MPRMFIQDFKRTLNKVDTLIQFFFRFFCFKQIRFVQIFFEWKKKTAIEMKSFHFVTREWRIETGL